MNLKRILLTLVAAAVMTGVEQAYAQDGSRDVIVDVGAVYIPEGQSTKAPAFVVVAGVFPNGCYHWSHSEVRSNNEFTHEIASISSVDQGMCTMALIPFAEEVELGFLPVGDHLLRFMNSNGTYFEKNLKIEAGQ